jgi:hypothetical protein
MNELLKRVGFELFPIAAKNVAFLVLWDRHFYLTVFDHLKVFCKMAVSIHVFFCVDVMICFLLCFGGFVGNHQKQEKKR